MKKVLMFLLLFVSLLGFIFGIASGKKVQAYSNGDVMLLICNPGEDSSTQMRFSFHTDVSGVTVQVAKKSDGNFDHATILTPECVPTSVAYPFGGTSYNMKWPSYYDPKTMQVCEADISGLEPGTEYMYRVGATNFSETRYFTTAGTDGTWGFVVMADPQNYSNPLHSNVNPNMNRAKANAQKLGFDLNLVLCAGDMVDTGGVIDWWDALFNGVDLYKEMPLAMIVGNHDCQDAAGRVWIGEYVTDSFWNAPRNNNNPLFTEDVYWFKWDNILFCCMNSEAIGSERKAAQDEWFRNVCDTVDHQYVVVMYHQGQWGTKSPSPNVWYNTFEEYGIDLSFSGDNHDYNRGGVMNVGPSRGQDNFPGHYVVVDDTRNASNVDGAYGGYCLVKVTPTCLYFYAYDQNDILRDSAVFNAKRPIEKTETFDKDAFEASFKIEVDTSNPTKAILSWSGEDYYGYVRDAIVLDENNNEVKKYLFTTLSQKTASFGGLAPYSSFNYKVKIDYIDGTSSILDMPFETIINYGTYKNIEVKKLSSNHRIIFDPNDIKANLFKECYVYVDGVKVATYEASAKFVAVDSSYITEDCVIELKGLSKADDLEYVIGTYSKTPAAPITYTVTFKADGKVLSTQTVEEGKAATAPSVNIDGFNFLGWDKDFSKVTSDLIVNAKLEKIEVIPTTYTVRFLVDGLEVSRQEVKENEAALKPADPVKEGYIFIGWDKEFNNVKSNLDINAKFEENEVITPDPVDPIIEPEPAKGCNSASIISIWGLILPLGLALVFRRKRFY